MRMATPPVFWVQKVAGTSTVRKKWSHRTLTGSAAGGHASGTGVDMTYTGPFHVRLGLVCDTAPLDGLAARTGIETTETRRMIAARVQSHQTRKRPDSPRARANVRDTESQSRPITQVGTRTGSFLDGNHLLNAHGGQREVTVPHRLGVCRATNAYLLIMNR